MKTNHFGGCFKSGSIFTSLLFLLCLAHANAAATGLETWENIFSLPGRTPQLPLQKIAVSNHRFVAIATEGQYVYSDDGVLWTNGIKSIFSGPAVGLVSGSGMFVAAGFSSLLSSADAIHWTNYPQAQKIPLLPPLRDVVYGSGLFVAVGGQPAKPTNHTFVTSSDGKNWQRKDVVLSAQMTAIAAGQGRFVGVGSGGTVWNSSDGTSWTEVAHVPAALSDCAYGEGWFVAVGNGGTVAFSDDGSHWQLVASGISKNITSVRFAGGIFYLGMLSQSFIAFEIQPEGQIHYLVSPTSSTSIFDVSGRPTDVTYDSGRYVAVGPHSIWNSLDGINWNLVAGFQGSTQINQIAVAGHRYFAFGQATTIIPESSSRPSFVLSSTDLISWQQSNSVADPSSRTGYIGFGNEIFAFEGPRVLASTDGLQWNVRYAETNFTTPSFAIDSTTGTLIAWGGLTSVKGIVATTRDGVVWQRHSVPALRPVNLTAAGNNIVVGVWSHLVSNSTNATTLAALDLTTDSLVQTNETNLGVYAIAYGNGIFVATGTVRRDGVDQGVSLVSRDGQKWQRTDAPIASGAQLVYANGWFVLGGVFASADGVTWMSLPGRVRAHLVFDGKQLIGSDGSAIFHSHDIVPPFIVSASTDADGFVVSRTSLDGMSIDLSINISLERRSCSGAVTTFPAHTLVIPTGQAFARESFVTGNSAELKLTVRPGEAYAIGFANTAAFAGDCAGLQGILSTNSLRREADGSISLQLDASASRSGEVEVSEDLRTWVPLGSQANGFSLKDADAKERPMRFYRLKPAP